MMNKLLLITLIVFSNISFAKDSKDKYKDITCDQVVQMLARASVVHVNSHETDEAAITKSLDTYLDAKDKYKLFLTAQQYAELKVKFSVVNFQIMKNIYTGDCHDYEEIDKLINTNKTYIISQLNNYVANPSGGLLSEKAEYDHQTFEDILKRIATLKYTKERMLSLVNVENSKKIDSFRPALILKSLLETYDPHSSYINAEATTGFLSEIKGSFAGIGVNLLLNDGLVSGYKIVRVIKGTPADRSNLKAGDLIVNIEGISISEDSQEEAYDALKGEEGSLLTLGIFRQENGKNKLFKETIMRENIVNDEIVARGEIVKIYNKKFLLIKMNSFYSDVEKDTSSSKDVKRIYQSFKNEGIDGIVMDLRNNGGGLLSESVNLAGLFIDQPQVVQVRYGNIIDPMQATKVDELINEPLVILTNTLSASATEIFAGALQDYGRAVIVGDQSTFGKGTVQTLISEYVSAGYGILKVSIGNFYLPSGNSTQVRGVISDVVIPSPTNFLDYKENKMRFALPFSKIGSLYDKHYSKSMMDRLREKSTKRIKNSPIFKNFKDKQSSDLWENSQEEIAYKYDDYMYDLKKDFVLKEAIDILEDFSR